jgi:uncharacterized coiled-coil DUF342 family protein
MDDLDDITVDAAIRTIRRLLKERDRLGGQVDEFRQCFGNLARERDELWNDLERVTVERDEARRIAAYQYAKHHNGDEDTLVRNFFAFRGWDCHKEKGHE